MANNALTPQGIISKEEFERMQARWLRCVKDAITNPTLSELLSLFKIINSTQTQLLYGYTLHKEKIKKILSVVGIKKVSIRFGVDYKPNSDNPYVSFPFRVIYYGTDNKGKVLTPYYEATNPVITQPHFLDSNSNSDPNPYMYPYIVPNNLAKHWIHNWNAILNSTDPLYDSDLIFSVTYVEDDPILRGYSYDINEIKQALYTSISEDSKDITLLFCLHKSVEPETPFRLEPEDTFGLIFQFKGNAVNTGIGDDGVLYADISAPCPVCCPVCN